MATISINEAAIERTRPSTNATIECEANKLMSEKALGVCQQGSYEELEESMQFENDEVENMHKSEKEKAEQIILTS